MMAPLFGKRIGLLTASASRQGGGVFEAVVAQTQLIASLGATPIVFALDDADGPADEARFGGATVKRFSISGPRQIGYGPGLYKALEQAGLDCLHLHGIWMYPSHAGAAWARKTGRPYIVSPHGMLDPWITSRGRWKKAMARAGYERRSWSRAWALHALTGKEHADIAAESGRSDSLVIPNAGPAALAGAPVDAGPVIGYLGRIHEKKNLVSLVEGWSQARKPVGAKLRIAGWGDAADMAALHSAISRAGQSVEFLGPLFGKAKHEFIEAARFMVLPSLSEGLPMAMLESWAAGRPAIMTEACNLPEGFASGAALNCGFDAGSIARAIEQALVIDEAAWRGMAQASLRLARSAFSAQRVAARWSEVYSQAIAGGMP